MTASDHDEWLIDESIEESFPASDSPTPVQPGSLVGQHYATERSRVRGLSFPGVALALIVVGSIVCVELYTARRRHMGWRRPRPLPLASKRNHWLHRLMA